MLIDGNGKEINRLRNKWLKAAENDLEGVVPRKN